VSRRTEIITIIGTVLALIALVFGDNIFQQVTGHSFGDDFRNFLFKQTVPTALQRTESSKASKLKEIRTACPDLYLNSF